MFVWNELASFPSTKLGIKKKRMKKCHTLFVKLVQFEHFLVQFSALFTYH